MKKLIYILLFLVTPLNLDCIANELIEPFGNIKWTDGIPSAITKLNNMHSVSVVIVKDKHDSKIATGIKTIKSSKAFFKTIKDQIGFRKNDTVVVDYNGKKFKINNSPLEVNAGLINIGKIPAIISLKFLPSPGLLISDFKNVLSDGDDIYYPVILYEVSLTSDSNSLITNHKKIDQIVLKKYKKYLKKTHESIGFRVYSSDKDFRKTGSANNILRTKINTKYMEIVYRNKYLLKEYSNKYQQYLATEAENDTKSQNNMSDSL